MNTNYNEVADQQEAADQEEVTYLDGVDGATQKVIVKVYEIFEYFRKNYGDETALELLKIVLGEIECYG